jgi:AcrR family transcriptional regulator
MAVEETVPVAQRRVGRPPRDEAGDLTFRVVATASRLFLERGYAGTSIEAIAQLAGVGKNTIYRRYSTKAELFQAVVDVQMRAHLPPLQSIQGGDDWVSGLRQVGLMLTEASVKPDTVALERLVIAEALRFPEIATIYIDSANARATSVVRDLLGWIHSHMGGEGAELEAMQFAAEQFISCMVYVPNTFALMGRRRFSDQAQMMAFVDRALALFLGGWISPTRSP